MVYTGDLKSPGASHAGSNPASATILKESKMIKHLQSNYGYKKGDLVRVEGWAKPSLFVEWTKQPTYRGYYRGNDEPTPEFAVLLHNGEIREAHVDYMIRIKEYCCVEAVCSLQELRR